MKAIAKTIMQGHKQDLAFSIDIAGQDPNSLLLTNFQLTETLSELYFGTATLISRDLNIDLNACMTNWSQFGCIKNMMPWCATFMVLLRVWLH